MRARLAGGAQARWVVVITAASDEGVPGLRVQNPVTPLTTLLAQVLHGAILGGLLPVR